MKAFVVALVALLMVQGIVMADVPVDPPPENGDVLTSFHYGDGIVDFAGIRMTDPQIETQDTNGDGVADQVRASANVRVNSANNGPRQAWIGMGELITGSTYEVMEHTWFQYYAKGETHNRNRKYTDWMICPTGQTQVAALMVVTNSVAQGWGDRSGPNEVVIPINCNA